MISKNGALIMTLQYPEFVGRYVNMAEAVIGGKPVWVCKHSPKNIEALRKLGLKVPSLPMEGEWRYTGRLKPYDHQRKTTEFLVVNDKCCVLSGMGVGKTASAIWAAEYLLQKGEVKRICIVCPLSVLGVWSNELFNCIPHRTNVVLYGDRAKRLQLLAQGSEFVIINHDGVTTIHEELREAGFDIIIADEASAYRNAGTKRYKLFKRLTQSIQRLWLMTGTPASKAPTDAWALIKLMLGKKFEMSQGAFKELVMRKVRNFVWIPRKEAKDIIYALMQPGIRFRKEDCIDLPPMTYVNRECEMSAEQKKAFEQMRKGFVMDKAQGGEITAANAAVKLIKLMQICCGVVKDGDENEPAYLDDSARLGLLEEVIREADNKAIVFVPFIAVMERIKAFLTAQGIACEIVNGDVSQTRREAIFNEFQNGTLPVLIAHPRTAAHGLTLTASSTIIWYAPIFSAELYEQGNARIHRPGQTDPCTIVHLGAAQIEWQLYKALEEKLRLQDVLLREYEELIK